MISSTSSTNPESLRKFRESRCKRGTFPMDSPKRSEGEPRFRKNRFMFTAINGSIPLSDGFDVDFGQEALNCFNLKPDSYDDSTGRRTLIEKAAQGLIVEGEKVGKRREAEWMAQQLLNVKNETREIVWQCCARLYTTESFLYKKLNEVMRLVKDDSHEELWERQLWKSKLATFGPFAHLLVKMKRERSLHHVSKRTTVYRGANLPDHLIEQYQSSVKHILREKGCYSYKLYIAFTSTSRNRAQAELIGNVLFVIDVDEVLDGTDIAPYSVFDEEEYLLDPHFNFEIESYNFDKATNKSIIFLTSLTLEGAPPSFQYQSTRTRLIVMPS
ncbi:unnamed protein product [Adineta ricciae]|uniref:Uncharacterized protein n=1 Tax=Adineta ricciae TaxID=249248 RepID=A0A815NVA2_ADIRI|nr:unnamed protein product [Adineta ricciae]CAF1655496.1 unnamed protein product [Adineta ricciae]